MTMTITTERKTVATLYSTDEQRAAIKIVDEMLELMQDVFSKEITLSSMTTGECLEIAEIARVRGVLDLLAQCTPFPIMEVLTPED